MRTLFYLLFALLLTTKTGFCQGADNDYNDYNNDEDDYNGGEEEEDSDGAENRPEPHILSTPQHFEAKPGSNVELPCKLDNPENGVLEWFFGTTRIFMEEVKMIEEPRYIKKADSLLITDVTEKDSGNYTCVLLDQKQYLSHTLSISSPVKIDNFYTTKDNVTRSDKAHSHAVWLKGSQQKIYCHAAGFPTPTVVITHLWMHGKHKSGQVDELAGNPVTIDPVERKHAGRYVCSASNAESSTSKSLQVEVEYPPEVHIKRDYIAAAVGKETIISCRVQAHPSATIKWMKYNDIYPVSAREILEDREGANHILKFRDTTENDFGVYTCIATNSHGTANKTVRVSGEPSRPVIQSADFDDDLVTPVLTWLIESKVPLMEYKLEYKKQENNDWNDVNKAGEVHSSPIDDNYIIRHKFDDLEEGTYHARIKARNQYGWSENSVEKTFSGSKAMPRAANTFAQLESLGHGSATELRTSLAFVLSLLVAHLLH